MPITEQELRNHFGGNRIQFASAGATRKPSRYTIESKASAKAPWKPSSTFIPTTREKAQAFLDDLNEMGGGVYRLAEVSP